MTDSATDDLRTAVVAAIFDNCMQTDALTGKKTAVLDSRAITMALSDVIALVCHTSREVVTPRGRRVFGEEVGKGIARRIAEMQQSGAAASIGIETLHVPVNPN